MRNWKKYLQKLTTEGISALLTVYQKSISPDHGLFRERAANSRCRFYPSCSEYTRQAFRQYGLTAGIVVSLKRILRCHPWNEGGYDPIKIQNAKIKNQNDNPKSKSS